VNHSVTHMNSKPYQCEHCGAYCGRRHLLKKHLALVHGETMTKKRTPSLIHYECKICQETFTSSSEVVLHRTRHWVVQEGQSVDPSKVSQICLPLVLKVAFSLCSTLVQHFIGRRRYLTNFYRDSLRKSLKNGEGKSKAAPRYNQPIAQNSSSKLPVTS